MTVQQLENAKDLFTHFAHMYPQINGQHIMLGNLEVTGITLYEGQIEKPDFEELEPNQLDLGICTLWVCFDEECEGPYRLLTDAEFERVVQQMEAF